MKKYSGPGYPMGSLNKLEAAAWEERRRNPRPSTKCDGCFGRFRGAPIDQDDLIDQDDDSQNEDVGDVFKRCTGCDYTICEYCSEPENQGEFWITPSVSFLLVLMIYSQESHSSNPQRAHVAAKRLISV
jgi:hypothetical protein